MITPEFISRDLFMSNDAPRLKRLSKEQWQRLIEEQQNSSMTQSEFCLSKELSLATFYVSGNFSPPTFPSFHP